MKNSYLAYLRVSTIRQGSHGISLLEQRHAIEAYADRHKINISEWLEERCSAARCGRPVFDLAMRKLKAQRSLQGLVLHKVDRGVRNLRDWASIGEAVDFGIDVRFVNDDFDLKTRGGRLAADIQAVIAADYIRNLKEEVSKGIQGRLRQGIYPFAAPRGYRDCGGGRVKSPDPGIAPLIIAAFVRYATGAYTLRSLATELALQGLVGNKGAPLSATAISRVLRNPFYVGKLVVSGIEYPGIHQPLIEQETYDAVQRQLADRAHRKRTRHAFLYRRQLICRTCRRCLTGERQKQHIYYRCHRCTGISVREDRVHSDPKAIYELRQPTDTPLAPYSEFESRTPLSIWPENYSKGTNEPYGQP